MNTWKLEIEYEGSRYRGWQHQHNERTVQGEMQKAAYELFSGRVELGGAVNTDAGVHALGQVACLRVDEIKEDVTPRMIQNSFNDLLPHDINIISVKNAPDTFEARSDVLAKQYLYKISVRRTAFGKSLVWWIKDDLDSKKMKDAAEILVGKHNFESFSQKNIENREPTTVEIENVEIFVQGEMIFVRIKAPHFLWKMVRRIVGVLAEVGRGNLSDTAIERLLKYPSDATAKFTAPTSGLYLEKVYYKP